MNEHDIIQGLLEKDNKTLSFLYNQYFGPKVVGYVINKGGNKSQGEEILQEAIIRLWQNVSNAEYKDQGKLKPYFWQIVRNVWLEHCRVRKRENVALTENHFSMIDGSEYAIEEKLLIEKRLIAGQRAIRKLKDKCRGLIFELHHKMKCEQMNQKEIAAARGYHYPNYRASLKNCRAKWKQLREEELKKMSLE